MSIFEGHENETGRGGKARPAMTTLVAAGLLLIGANAAGAHVTAIPDSAPVSAHFIAHFTVPHGCAGSPTIAVRITLPTGLSDVKPERKPGWKITIKRFKFSGPGPEAQGPPEEIEWRGGPLPDDEFETFDILMMLPPRPGILYFPTVQSCKQGENRWLAIPTEGERWRDVKDPAPFLRVIAPAE